MNTNGGGSDECGGSAAATVEPDRGLGEVRETRQDERPARDYARLHKRWYEDPVLRAVADEEPAAMTLWPVLVALAKDASHTIDNPNGVVKTTARRLADSVYLDEKRVRRALALLQEGDLVSLVDGRLGSVEITLPRFAKWQVPCGGDADRQQTRRDRSQKQRAGEKHRYVTDASQVRNGSVTQTETETETETETSKEGLPKGNHVRTAPSAPRPSGRLKVRSFTDEDVSDGIALARSTLNGCGDRVEALCRLLAERNKTGTVASSRLLRELWQPLSDALTDGRVSREALRHGLDQAIAAGVPNRNWVLKAASGYHPPTQSAAAPRASYERASEDMPDYDAATIEIHNGVA